MDSPQLFVVFGLDSEKKPHAARFNVVDEDVVRKAAGAKGFKIGVPKTKEAAELAGKLIEGKIFDSGRGLVPFVTRETYDKLAKLIEVKEAEQAYGPQSPLPAKTPSRQILDPWLAIKAGSIVLARDPEPGPERSYWPCVVSEVVGRGDALVVRWKDYPKLPPFRVKRTAVALLPK